MNENITPLPWKIQGWSIVSAVAKEPRGRIQIQAPVASVTHVSERSEQNNANAEYIVTACNAYPTLTARVKELEELSQALLDHVSLPRMQGLSDKGTRLTWLDELHGPRERLRAALNKEPT